MPNVPIIEIKVSFRTRFDVGNIAELAEDIQRHGLLHPLVVTPENELVAGYRRLKAVELLGWKEVSVTIVTPAQSLAQFDMQLSENMKRKELNILELSEAILERKHRFEQVCGKIQNGGDHCSEEYQKSSFTAGETALPNFYQETAVLLNKSTKYIYDLLQLHILESDLKEQVRNRTLSYRAALEQQAQRNRVKKQVKKQKSTLQSVHLPNEKNIAPLQAQYQSAPNLMNLFMLVQHSFQTVQQMKEKSLEFDKFELEYLFLFIQQLETVIAYYRELLVQLNQSQERKIIELAKS